MKDSIIICRCQDVTEQEIVDAIKKYNLSTVDEVKRVTRAGMGHCQGKTCRKLVEQILNRELSRPVSADQYTTLRPPTRAVPLDLLANAEQSIDKVVSRGRGGHNE
ncbi:MAG: (2Fe-2S)-binding protein [bacterium]